MKTVFNDGSPVWLKFISGLLIFSFLFVLLNALTGRLFASDPDSELRAAKERYTQALRGHCSIIGARVQKCYTGDTEECTGMQKSVTWFMSADGYGEAPEVACRDLTANLD